MYSELHIQYSTAVRNIHCTQSVECIVYSLQFTVYSVNLRVHSAHPLFTKHPFCCWYLPCVAEGRPCRREKPEEEKAFCLSPPSQLPLNIDGEAQPPFATVLTELPLLYSVYLHTYLQGSVHKWCNPILDTRISVLCPSVGNAQTTPPGFWNGVDWRALVKD